MRADYSIKKLALGGDQMRCAVVVITRCDEWMSQRSPITKSSVILNPKTKKHHEFAICKVLSKIVQDDEVGILFLCVKKKKKKSIESLRFWF